MRRPTGGSRCGSAAAPVAARGEPGGGCSRLRMRRTRSLRAFSSRYLRARGRGRRGVRVACAAACGRTARARAGGAARRGARGRTCGGTSLPPRASSRSRRWRAAGRSAGPAQRCPGLGGGGGGRGRARMGFAGTRAGRGGAHGLVRARPRRGHEAVAAARRLPGAPPPRTARGTPAQAASPPLLPPPSHLRAPGCSARSRGRPSRRRARARAHAPRARARGPRCGGAPRRGIAAAPAARAWRASARPTAPSAVPAGAGVARGGFGWRVRPDAFSLTGGLDAWAAAWNAAN